MSLIFRAQERPGRLRLPLQGCRPQAHVGANHTAFANRHSGRRGARGDSKHTAVGGGQIQGSQGEIARRVQEWGGWNGRPYHRRELGRFRNRPIVPDNHLSLVGGVPVEHRVARVGGSRGRKGVSFQAGFARRRTLFE